jgi:hypothetical protein
VSNRSHDRPARRGKGVSALAYWKSAMAQDTRLAEDERAVLLALADFAKPDSHGGWYVDVPDDAELDQ